MKLENDTNKAMYLPLLYSFKLSFVKKINSAPTAGNKISEDNIGKFIYFNIKKVSNKDKPSSIIKAY